MLQSIYNEELRTLYNITYSAYSFKSEIFSVQEIKLIVNNSFYNKLSSQILMYVRENYRC